MDKYGVDQNKKPVNEKQAHTPTLCPLCNKPLRKEGNVYLCPEHGSKPFEK